MSKEDLDQVFAFFRTTVASTKENACQLEAPQFAGTYILGAILASLRELIAKSQPLGMTYYRITPFSLTDAPLRIIEKEPSGLLRKVSFAIDSAVGGPTPTIRFGSSSVSANNGGVRLNAGVINELGEVAPGVELYAASSTPISGYVIERA